MTITALVKRKKDTRRYRVGNSAKSETSWLLYPGVRPTREARLQFYQPAALGHNGMQPVKRRQALLESNLPRNNRLKLIVTMMCGGYPPRWLPHRRANIGAKDFPCLKKLTPSPRGNVSIALAAFVFVLHDRELAALAINHALSFHQPCIRLPTATMIVSANSHLAHD